LREVQELRLELLGEGDNVAFGLSKFFGNDDENARTLFINWSNKTTEEQKKTPEVMWDSITERDDDESIGIGTVLKYASEAGYPHLLSESLYSGKTPVFNLDAVDLMEDDFLLKCALISRCPALQKQWALIRQAIVDARVVRISDFERAISSVGLPYIDLDRPPTLLGLALIAVENLKLYQTSDRRAIAVDGQETYIIKSSAFKAYLRIKCSENNLLLNRETISNCIDEIEARALRGEIITPKLRVAKVGGKHYVDLCDKERIVVEIDKTGWRLINNAADLGIYFLRKDGMLPIPIPKRGCKMSGLAHLRWLLRAETNPSASVLSICWLLWAMQEAPEYANLGVFGKSDDGKSTFCSFLRGWIDPHRLEKRSPSKNARDMYIAASQQHVYLLDNASARRALADDLQNDICRINTGGGRGDKTNYTDEDETILVLTKPTMMNGINNPITNEDLHSRTVFVDLEPFQPNEKVDKELVYKRYEETKGEVLGCLLDIFAQALNNYKSGTVDEQVRMIGFANFSIAAETAFAEPGTFLRHYKEAAREAADSMLASDLTFEILVRVVRDKPGLKMENTTASELWSCMMRFMGDHKILKGERYFPANGQALSRWIRANTPAMQKIGCVIKVGGVNEDDKDTRRSSSRRPMAIEITKGIKDMFGPIERFPY
jgi:hypothetical protein